MTAAATIDWDDAPDASPLAGLPAYVTYAQVCAATQLSRSTVTRAVAAGELPRYGGPRSARFLRTDVEAWLARPIPERATTAAGRRLPAGLPDVGLAW